MPSQGLRHRTPRSFYTFLQQRTVLVRVFQRALYKKTLLFTTSRTPSRNSYLHVALPTLSRYLPECNINISKRETYKNRCNFLQIIPDGTIRLTFLIHTY